MKKYFYALGFIFIFSIQLSAQQIPNSGFENWTNSKPDKWATSNQSIPLLGTFNAVTKETADPQQGTASVKLSVLSIYIPFNGTYRLPGLLTLGKLNIDVAAQTASVTGGIPFTATPEKLTGYYKYYPVNNDQCVLGWGLTRWANGTRDTIGYGLIDTNVILNTWTYFEIPLRYHKPLSPDTMNILFLNSNPLDGLDHTGTNMWIDNLAFVYGYVGIEGVSFPEQMRIYAQPNASQLVLSSTFAKAENLDISLINMGGTEARRWKRTMAQSTEYLDISNLKPGTYVIRITSGSRMIDTRKITILR